MAKRYLKPNGWYVRLMLEMSRNLEWRREGERNAAGRAEVEPLLRSFGWNSQPAEAESADALSPSETVWEFTFPCEPGRRLRAIVPQSWAVHQERSRRAEENRKAKVARSERAQLRRACAKSGVVANAPPRSRTRL